MVLSRCGKAAPQDLVARTLALLAALGAVAAPFMGFSDWLVRQYGRVAEESLAAPLAAGTAVLVFLVAAWFVWRSFRKVSVLRQRDAFDLRARTSDDLIGRDADIRDFAALVQGNQLVFLTGDSGSGKSALVAAGLVPALRQGGQFLSILVARYGTDWVLGPTREAFRALWEACSPEQRAALDWNQPPARPPPRPPCWPGSCRRCPNGSNGSPACSSTSSTTTRRSTARASPGSTAAGPAPRNSAGRTRSGTPSPRPSPAAAMPLVVTRRDTAEGLHAARLAEAPAQRPLDWVDGHRLEELLDRIAPAEANPPVVQDPEHGWVQLKPLLARELYREFDVSPVWTLAVAGADRTEAAHLASLLRERLAATTEQGERSALLEAMANTVVRARGPGAIEQAAQNLLLAFSDPFGFDDLYVRIADAVGKLAGTAPPTDWLAAVAALQRLGADPAKARLPLKEPQRR